FLLPADGQHHDGYARSAAYRFADLKPARPRHVDVENHEVRRLVGHGTEGGGSVRRLDDEVAGLRQREADQVPQVAVIVRHEDLHAITSTGSTILNRVRPSSVRSTPIVPPCRSTMERTIQSPNPSPPGSGSRSGPRWKGANRPSPAGEAGPGPSSSTHTARRPSSDSQPIRTVLPSGANLLALASRFTNTCVRRCLSPSTGGSSSGSETS